MQITYKENPLCSTVELDETDQIIFRLKIKVEELQDCLGSVQMSLEDGGYLDRDKKIAYSFEDFEENGVFDKRIDNLFNWYVKSLRDTHCGDCTCVSSSCSKCRAEDILGINTLGSSPGKHSLRYIDSAFGKNNEKTLLEAIKYLKNYKVDVLKPESWTHSTQEQYESYIPGWEAEGVRAYEYLKNYAREKFGVVEEL